MTRNTQTLQFRIFQLLLVPFLCTVTYAVTATEISNEEADGRDQISKWHNAKNAFHHAVRQKGLTSNGGDGNGGEGFVVQPLIRSNPTTVIVVHGLGGNGEEVRLPKVEINCLWN